ncbi:envelope stress response membrane protein PspC [Pacificimonas sp. WHA3]|uniref:Envelope stress response membrane protein PspC n=1 Tax=Pacificimonas pallii TaxID=2827236 RepID=A0ABS6SCT6_9SPHN|nr:envelope stress response membrane protein PspC [Pacificimonas pallii]MBV7256237.1 envelope stress response membrane protein PspC [Pacificimonas pallii]
MTTTKRFFRNKRDGKWLGVCAGLADYTGIDVVWWRLGAVLTTIFALGPILPVAYIATGVIADRKPAELYRDNFNPEEERFAMQTRRAPLRSLKDVHGRFRALDRRLSEVERGVTTQNSGLAREIDSL